jgi:predicted DNA-binding transcriptional regulator AlpA
MITRPNVTPMELLNTPEASVFTGIPEATLRWWRHLGDKGPRSAKLGNRVVYRKQDLVDWVNAAFEEDRTTA